MSIIFSCHGNSHGLTRSEKNRLLKNSYIDTAELQPLAFAYYQALQKANVERKN